MVAMITEERSNSTREIPIGQNQTKWILTNNDSVHPWNTY